MKCPLCAEKIQREAFVCRYCQTSIIPHASSVLSSITSLFSKREMAISEVSFHVEFSAPEIIDQMETISTALKQQGYDVFWRWRSDIYKTCELIFSYKGNANFMVYSKVVNSLSKQITLKCGDDVQLQSLRKV